MENTKQGRGQWQATGRLTGTKCRQMISCYRNHAANRVQLPVATEAKHLRQVDAAEEKRGFIQVPHNLVEW